MGDVGRNLGGMVGGMATMGGLGGIMGSGAIGEDARKFATNPLGTVGDFLGTNPQSLDLSGFSPTEQERAFTTYLAQQAMGQGGPTAAQTMLTRGMDQANANAMAMGAAQRGVSPGLAARLVSQQQAMNQQQAMQQASILRAQEQQAAQALVGQQFGSQRGTMAQGQALQIQSDQAAQARRNQLISGLGNAAIGYATGGASTLMPGGGPISGGPAAPMTTASHGSYLGSNQTFTPAFSKGGKVPGKAQSKGDSPKNDTVPAMLSPGEMVIPRSVVSEGPDAIKSFAQALLKKEGKKDGKKAA